MPIGVAGNGTGAGSQIAPGDDKGPGPKPRRRHARTGSSSRRRSQRQPRRRGAERRSLNGVYARRGGRRASWAPRESGGSATARRPEWLPLGLRRVRWGASAPCPAVRCRPYPCARAPPVLVPSGRGKAAATIPTVSRPPRRPDGRPDPMGCAPGRERSPSPWRCGNAVYDPCPDSGRAPSQPALTPPRTPGAHAHGFPASRSRRAQASFLACVVTAGDRADCSAAGCWRRGGELGLRGRHDSAGESRRRSQPPGRGKRRLHVPAERPWPGRASWSTIARTTSARLGADTQRQTAVQRMRAALVEEGARSPSPSARPGRTGVQFPACGLTGGLCRAS